MVEVEGEDENAHKKLNSTQKFCIQFRKVLGSLDGSSDPSGLAISSDDFRHLGMPDKLRPLLYESDWWIHPLSTNHRREYQGAHFLRRFLKRRSARQSNGSVSQA
jgi:hypothetical protein